MIINFTIRHRESRRLDILNFLFWVKDMVNSDCEKLCIYIYQIKKCVRASGARSALDFRSLHFRGGGGVVGRVVCCALRINAASTGSCVVRIAQELAFFLFPDVADGSEHIRYRDPRSEGVEQVFRKPDATHHLTIDGGGDSLVKEPEVEDFALPGEFGLILGLQAIGSGDVEGFLLY